MQCKQVLKVVIAVFLSSMTLWIAFLAIRLSKISQQIPQPQALLVLGGGQSRELAAADIAQYYPDIEIWISSGSEPGTARSMFQAEAHMPRAKAIGTVVLGSRGIVFTPIAVTDDQTEEPRAKLVRDLCRSLLWVLTGRTGEDLRSQ